MVSPLNDFKEEGGAILEWLGKDLQKISLVVVVNEDLLALQDVDVFLHLEVLCSQAGAKLVVVGVWDLVKEHDTAGLHASDSLDDAFSAHGNVLDAGTSIIVAELLDLTLTHAIGRLVDWHLDLLVEVGHDDRAQGGELCVDHLVIHGPEAVEVKHLLVPRGNGLHLSIWLVSNAVINVQKLGDGHQTVQGLGQVMGLEAWQKDAGELVTLNESVDRVSVCLDTSKDDTSKFVGQSLRSADTSGTFCDSLFVDTCSIVDSEGHVLDSVTVLGVMSRELGVVGVQG